MISKKEFKEKSCAVPFLVLSTTSEGTILPCCWHTEYPNHVYKNEDGSFSNIHEDEIEKILESPSCKQIKNHFLNLGADFGVCETTCFSAERAGMVSKRKMIYEMIEEKEDEIIDRIIAGEIKFPKLIEVKITNLCNLRCVTCNPINSSSIMAHYEPANEHQKNILGRANRTFKIYTEKKAKVFLDSILKNLDCIELLEFYGGEPFMIHDHKKFLQKIIDSGFSKKITLAYITNGTKYDSDYLTIFNQFKGVSINVSIDAFGKLNDEIRLGSKWEDVSSNLKKYLEMRDSKIISSVNVNSTISCYSLFGIFDLISYLEKLDPIITMSLSILVGPAKMRIELVEKSEIQRWIYLYSLIDPDMTRFYSQLTSIYERLKDLG